MNEQDGQYGLVSDYPYEMSIQWFKTLQEAVEALQGYNSHEHLYIVVRVKTLARLTFVNPLTGETVESSL